MSTQSLANHNDDEAKLAKPNGTKPKRKGKMSFRKSTGGQHGNSYESRLEKSKSFSHPNLGSSGEVSRYKLVMIGDSGVGKSCLLEKLLDTTSTNSFISTIGVDIKNLLIRTVYGRLVRLEIWDTGGQQRYRPVLSSCYRKAVGIIAVFDVTSRRSFDNIKQWMLEVDEFASFLAMRETTPKLLIGNKCDLTDGRTVDWETASQYAAERSMMYVETSARESCVIQEAILALVQAGNLAQQQ